LARVPNGSLTLEQFVEVSSNLKVLLKLPGAVDEYEEVIVRLSQGRLSIVARQVFKFSVLYLASESDFTSFNVEKGPKPKSEAIPVTSIILVSQVLIVISE
jgi:hypothetical protein